MEIEKYCFFLNNELEKKNLFRIFLFFFKNLHDFLFFIFQNHQNKPAPCNAHLVRTRVKRLFHGDHLGEIAWKIGIDP